MTNLRAATTAIVAAILLHCAHVITAQSLAVAPSTDVAAASDHTHIEMIDVMCDAGADAMEVTVAFDAPFAGIIYSRGFFSDPKCRYVRFGGQDRVYTFRVPLTGCGSRSSCSLCDSVDNVLVIQSDENVQEMWDVARKVSCSSMPSNSSVSTGTAIPHSDEKTIIFRPFVVEQLEVVSVPTSRGGVDCWMDIQRGRYPKVEPLADTIRIGEVLSVMVFLRDPKQAYDLIVRDCYAFDAADYEASDTSRLQLSDKRGCSRKRKLFGQWQRRQEQRENGQTLVLYNALSAFKFPDRAQVFLKCEVEICRGECEQPDCESEENEVTPMPKRGTRPTKMTTTVAPFTRRVPPSRSSPAPFSMAACQPGSRDRRCRFPSTTRVPTTVTTEVSTYRPPVTDPTTAPSCQPGPRNRCRGTRPSFMTTTETVQTTMRPSRRQPQPFTMQLPPMETPRRHTMATRQQYETTTYIPRTRMPHRGRTTTSGPAYLPPLEEDSTTVDIPTTAAPLRCYPGSRDPRCEVSTTASTTRRSTTTTEATTITEVTTTTEAPITRRTTILPTTTTAPTTTTMRTTTRRTTQRPETTTTVPSTTVTIPTTTVPRTTPAARCYPGSLDPRCPTTTRRTSTRTTPLPTTTTYATTSRPTTTRTTTSPSLRPNCDDMTNLDPRCSKLEPATYLPPFADTKTPRTRPTTTSTTPTTTRTTTRVTTTTTRAPTTTTTTRAPTTPTITRAPTTTTTIRPPTTATTRTPTTATTQPPPTSYPACPPGSRSPKCPPPPSDFEAPEYLPPFLDPLPAALRSGRKSSSFSDHPHIASTLPHGLADEINEVFAERRRLRRDVSDTSLDTADLDESISFAMTFKGYEIGRHD